VKPFEHLRIGLIGPLPPPGGGMANQTRQLAELLRGEGALVEVVQTNSRYRPALVSRARGLRAVFRLVPFVLALWRTAGQVQLFHVMANSGWAWHLFAVPPIWIARLRRVPVIVNYRGGEAAAFLEKSARLVRCSMRRCSSLAVPSKFLKGTFASHGMAAQVVPNIVDLSRFHPGSPDRKPGAHIVVARNLEPIYDNESAIRALKLVLDRCPSARLTIAGGGPEADRLRALASTLGVERAVRFVGRLDADSMADLYRDADIALNPSRADNMPNSLLEAMASGVPIVSTNVGGVPFMVEDGVTALLVDAGDVPAMAAALVRLLDDRSLWLGLSTAGLQRVADYTWRRVAPELAAVYREALGRA
jgi:glycosyltransferase involved in cell wall biosynthesis